MLNALYNIILSPITQIIEISYRVFDKMFGSTGISLLGVSLTVTLLCLPLYIVAESWQETERQIQEKMKGNIARIKKYFKGDEQYMILNTYYRQNHYHPIMALRSSFGILIQIPFFFAAYHTLSSLPDLQGKAFMFIRDMGKPDSIFTIHGFGINILPIAMTVINCISGAIYSKGHGIREKIQIYGMAALFLVVLYQSPAGLVLYWTMNNIFSLVKNVFYKMKNPLKVFYICAVTALSLLALFILFGYSGGAGMKKRLPAALFLLIWIPVPYYIKGINWFNTNILKSINENTKLCTGLFFISAIGIAVLNGLVLPSSLMASSVQEFSNIDNFTNPTGFLHSSFWMSVGLMVFWPACIYFLFNQKVKTVMAFLFSIFLTGAFINAFGFAGNYGSMDETLKLIDGFKNPSKLFMLLNILAIAVSIILVSVLIKFNKTKIISNVYMAAIFGLVVFTVVNTSKINKEYKAYSEKLSLKADSDSAATKFHLSKTKQNIVVFMVDRFAGCYVPSILSDQPQIKNELTGFTYYPNTVSFNGHTLMGSPAVYGGYDYTPYSMNSRPDETLKDKHNQAILLMPAILRDKGFKSVLSDISWANYSYVADMSFTQQKNPETGVTEDKYQGIHGISLLSKYSGDFKKEKLLPGNDTLSLSHVINRNLFWVSLFREVPSPLRSVVYYKGTWWENGVKEAGSSFAEWFSALYFMNRITDFNSDSPTLSVITNECTHSNEDISMYDLKLEGEYSINNDNAYKIDSVTLNQLAEFIKYLKANNVYDNTRIIIVSDHGIGNRMNQNYTEKQIGGYSKDHLNPVLLVKDFNAKGALITNYEFMTNADVPTLALSGIIENPVNPFTGNKIPSVSKDKGVRVTTADLFMDHHSKSKNIFTVPEDSWWYIKDNIFVDQNWTKVAD